ncbi:unnamed protein product, partial [Ectocarpus sp. 13 AM-2016]
MEQHRYSGVPDQNARPIHGAPQADGSATGYAQHQQQIYRPMRSPDSHAGVGSSAPTAAPASQ